MKIFENCEDINDIKSILCQHADREWVKLWEVWIDDYRLCYIMREKVDEDRHTKDKLQFFQEKYGRKLEHTGTTTNYSSKRKDHTGKINLCKYIDPWKSKSEEIKKRVYAETGKREDW